MRDRKRAWRASVRAARERVRARRFAERAASYGLSVADYRAALAVACRLWVRRWRWITRPVAALAWPYLGRRFAARFLAKWGAHG